MDEFKTTLEMLGNPNMDELEQRFLKAQARYLEVRGKDQLAEQSAYDLLRRYAELMQFLDENAIIQEAKSGLARASGALSKLKKLLSANEQVVLTKGETKYQMINQNGEPIQDLDSTDSLAIAKLSNLTPELLASVAKREKGATKAVRAIAKEFTNRKVRLAQIQECAADIGRALLTGSTLVVNQGKAHLEASGKASRKEMKLRLKMVQEGKFTVMEKGMVVAK